MIDDELERARYFIDLKWYEDNQRSFGAMSRARFCGACKAKLGTETQERMPTFDTKKGRVVFEQRTVAFGSNPLAAIRTCCSKAADFITPETPLAEAVFRLFLANGNQPSDTQSLSEMLAEWVQPVKPAHTYAPEVLERLIASDNHYGLRLFVTQRDEQPA